MSIHEADKPSPLRVLWVVWFLLCCSFTARIPYLLKFFGLWEYLKAWL